MQTVFYGKIKERKSEWLIGANTQNVLYFSIVATQHKTRQRRVLIIGLARRCEGAQFSRLENNALKLIFPRRFYGRTILRKGVLGTNGLSYF